MEIAIIILLVAVGALFPYVLTIVKLHKKFEKDLEVASNTIQELIEDLDAQEEMFIEEIEELKQSFASSIADLQAQFTSQETLQNNIQFIIDELPEIREDIAEIKRQIPKRREQVNKIDTSNLP